MITCVPYTTGDAQLCQKYLKKMPKFIGLTLEALQRDIKQYDDGEDGESAEDDEDNDNAGN